MSTSEASESARARVGTVVGQKWRLDALVAHSSTAATYKATHRNGAEVALKIIHPAHSGSPAVVERFLQEAHLANRIEHPSVERVLDDGQTEDGCVFLVMELLEGESLEDRLQVAGGKLSLEEARDAFDGMLEALVAIHAAGVHHRNLKPGNVFLAKDGRVVLTDFGRARFAEGDPNAGRSMDGLVLGTPSFMSPEQARGQRSKIDALSDVWSAGAILFTVLTGRRLHDGKTVEARILGAQMNPAPKIASVLPDIPADLAAVIDRALAFERADRWPSISEMRRAFWAATGRPASSLPADPKPATGRHPSDPDAPPAMIPAPVISEKAPEIDPVLLPLTSFISTPPEPMSVRSIRRERRSRAFMTAAIGGALLFVGVTIWLVSLVLGD